MGDMERGEFVEVDWEDDEAEGEANPKGEQSRQSRQSEPFDEEEDADKISQIIEWICEEIETAKAEREERYEKVERYRRVRQNAATRSAKDYPYPNSSNVAVPLSLILSQGSFGVLKSTFGQRIPFWSVKALRNTPEDREDMVVLEKYFHLISESPFDLALRRRNRTVFYEAVTLGTCYVKVPWKQTQMFFKKGVGGTTQQVSTMLHHGPMLEPIPYEDVLFREGVDDIQKLAWMSHEITLQKHELEDRMAQGVYQGVEGVLKNPRTRPKDRVVSEGESQDKVVSRVEEYDIHEVYFFYDCDGDGINEDVIFHVHLPTKTLMKQQYNGLGWRPFEAVPYFQIPYSIDGRGVCETVEGQQVEIDAVHNLRNDNMKLANMRMIAVKRTSGMSTRERMSPGKIWYLENPREDINVVQLGEIYPSSTQEENMLYEYAKNSVAMPDIMQGLSDQMLKSRDTWRGQETRLGQASGMFDAITEGVQDAYAKIGMLIFFQLASHRDEVIAKEERIGRLTDEEIEVLDRVLSIPVDEVPRRVNFSINTSEVTQTYEARKQNLLMLAQITTQAQQQLMPLAQVLLGPQGQQMMQQAPALFQYLNDTFVGNWTLLKEVYQFAGEEDVENYVPDITRQEKLRELLRRMSQQAMEGANLPITGGSGYGGGLGTGEGSGGIGQGGSGGGAVPVGAGDGRPGSGGGAGQMAGSPTAGGQGSGF